MSDDIMFNILTTKTQYHDTVYDNMITVYDKTFEWENSHG